MAYVDAQRWPDRVLWALVRRQHGVISWWQLLAAGFSEQAILHRLAKGRLHRLMRGVYAVGRPDVAREGWLMAAVLSAGGDAWISHETGCELLEVRRPEPGPIEVSTLAARRSSLPAVKVHRRTRRDRHTTTEHDGIPVSTVPALLVDMAHRWPSNHLEAAINQADARDLLNPDQVRAALNAFTGQPGVRRVRELLDAATFLLTDSELERRFLRLVRGAAMPDPVTQKYLGSHRVDFIWPDHGVVAEVDGLRYHRTPFQQRRDIERDQANRRRGLVPLRFTHWQVRYAPHDVLDGLARELRLTG